MPGWWVADFVAELKRRNVFRVAAVYAVVAFVIAQVADIVFPALHLPAWTVTLVVVLLLLGMPVALVLAWAFELTPAGVVRTPSVGAGGWQARWVAAAAGGTALLVLAGGIVLLGTTRGVADGSGGLPVGVEASIAVLPFADLSPGRDHEWFSDGITEDILLHLSQIADLKVIGRTSVMRYKGQEVGARQIGADLNVANILEGSVRRSGSQVRVVVKLIHAPTDEQLWAESFDQELTDIFQIQSEIARQIAGTLQARLSPEQHVRLARVPTESLSAYDLYLRAREHNQRLSRSDLAQAMDLFREAIALDPDFALAHAGLGFAFAAMQGYHHDGLHWLDSAFIAARTAIALDPNGADGYGVLALAQWNDGQLRAGVETYGRTLALRPSDADSHWGLAFTRWLQGELAEAHRLARRAVELDPGHPGFVTLLGRIHVAMGDGAGGERWYRRALDLQPSFPWAHQDLLWLMIAQDEHDRAAGHLQSIAGIPDLTREYEQNQFLLSVARGDHQAAAAWFDGARTAVIGGIVTHADVGMVLARAGEEARAREVWRQGVAEAEAEHRRSPEDRFPPMILGRIAAAMGEADRALDWLERAADLGWRGYPAVDPGLDPVLADLRGDARFEGLRQRVLDDVARARQQAAVED